MLLFGTVKWILETNFILCIGLAIEPLDLSCCIHLLAGTRMCWASHTQQYPERLPNWQKKKPVVRRCLNFLIKIIFYVSICYEIDLMFFLCEVYETAQSSMIAFKKWRMGGPRFQRASILGRKRKPVAWVHYWNYWEPRKRKTKKTKRMRKKKKERKRESKHLTKQYSKHVLYESRLVPKLCCIYLQKS